VELPFRISSDSGNGGDGDAEDISGDMTPMLLEIESIDPLIDMEGDDSPPLE
jgi:hypothetical protein